MSRSAAGRERASEAGGAGTGATDSTSARCPACGGETYRRHCKYVCPDHGVVMDCADTFW